MAEPFEQTLAKISLQFWLKGALAILFVKEALTEFVDSEIKQFQKDVLQTIMTSKGLPQGTTCSSCTTASLLKCPTDKFCDPGKKCKAHASIIPTVRSPIRCSIALCNELKDAILSEHRFEKPFWKNTDAQRWCSDAFYIAKCYMPEGYSDVKTINETDFNGILSVIINNKRFQNKMKAKLDRKPNICTKAREIGRTIRHSSDYLLSEKELNQYIDDLISLLCDSAYLVLHLKSQEAVNKLKQLKTNQLMICPNDITNVLSANLGEVINQKQKELFKGLNEYAVKIEREAALALSQHIKEASEEFEKAHERKKQELLKFTKSRQVPEDFVDFRREFIAYYRRYQSRIPLSPLTEEHDVPLIDLYVQPPMVYVDMQRQFGNLSEVPIYNYMQLFSIREGNVNKDIYLEANAGVGKTSFCKWLCMTWCQAHDPWPNVSNKFNPEDLKALKHFQFFFLISLRNMSETLTDLDEYITKVIQNNFQKKSENFIQDLFNTTSCLVVMDGLDEYNHPKSCPQCKGVTKIPHRKFRNNWTILTTNRPWKFVTLELSSTQIDKYVYLKELDESSVKLLVEKASNLLKSSMSEEIVEKFENSISQKQLWELSRIPYIILQLLCIWSDSKEITSSRCQIFTSVIELTLKRGTRNIESVSTIKQENTALLIPKCLHNKKECILHFPLLLTLGKLAFHTLFDTEKSSVLVFDKSVALNYLKENDFKACLGFGFLSQSKYFGPVSERQSHVMFQHKILQEFFAALYIQSDSETVQARSSDVVLHVCSSLKAMLDFSQVFIFLNGLRPKVYQNLVKSLIRHVSTDVIASNYRTKYLLGSEQSVYKALSDFQELQVKCLEECLENGLEYCLIPLEDIIVNRKSKDKARLTSLAKIIDINNVKSLSIRECKNIYEVTELLKTLNFKSLHDIVKLELWAVIRQKDIERIFLQITPTLKCLVIRSLNYSSNKYASETSAFSQKSVELVLEMKMLEALYLESLSLEHDQLVTCCIFLHQRKQLKQIGLKDIKCEDINCNEIDLDLSTHNRLLLIHLWNVPIAQLLVNPDPLEECVLGKLAAGATASWLKNLPNANHLEKLTYSSLSDDIVDIVVEIIPKLIPLESLYIGSVNFGENILMFSPQMNRLKLIELEAVSLTSATFAKMVKSIKDLRQPVEVILRDCTVSPGDDYSNQIVEMNKSDAFFVFNEGMVSNGKRELKFQTIPEQLVTHL